MFRAFVFLPPFAAALLAYVADDVPKNSAPRASRITIVGDAVPLQQALDQLNQQSKARVFSALPKVEKLKLDLKQATFWEALDRIATGANAEVQLYRDDGQIELLRRGPVPKMPVSYSGLFRVALRRVTAVHDFANQTRSLSLVVETAWEPSFDPFYLETRPQKIVLTDEVGKPVTVAALGSSWTPVDGKRVLSFEVNLPAMPRSAGKIGTFKGVLPVRGPSGWHDFRWKDKDGKELNLTEIRGAKLPLQAEQLRGSGTKCSIEEVKISMATWTLQVAVQLPEGGPEFESYQPWFANNQVYLASLDGKRTLKPTRISQESAGVKRAVMNYSFTGSQRGKLNDWVVVCRAPTAIIEMDIPFEFKNVELP